MATLSTDDLLDVFKDMTLLELTEFSKKFEETFGVTAAVPVTHIDTTLIEPEVEEQTEFDVILQSAGDKKIHVIKIVRELTKLGLKEAKDLVDAAPKPVVQQVSKESAAQAQAKLEAAGATATVT